jgi:hypothetical protein
MIVRILGDNQYELESKYLDEINELDNCMVDHLNDDKIDEFKKCLNDMIKIVKGKGTPLDPTEIVASDVIIPSPDITPKEAKKLFTGEGLISE